MTPQTLLAVAIAAMGVWLLSTAIVLLLASLIGELAYLVVGFALLAVAWFVARSRPWIK